MKQSINQESQEGNAKSSNGMLSIKILVNRYCLDGSWWYGSDFWKWEWVIIYSFLLKLEGTRWQLDCMTCRIANCWLHSGCGLNSVSLFPESYAVFLTVLYSLEFSLFGDCLQIQIVTPFLYFSGLLLASLVSVLYGRKTITCYTLHMQKHLTIINAWHSSLLPRGVSQYHHYSLGINYTVQGCQRWTEQGFNTAVLWILVSSSLSSEDAAQVP